MRGPLVALLTTVAVALGWVGPATPASALVQAGGVCIVRYEPVIETAGGYRQTKWTVGQKMVLKAYGLWSPTGDCSGADNSITWELKVGLPYCGELPTLAEGSGNVTQTASWQLLAEKTFTIPSVCPAGSEYQAGQPIGAGPAYVLLSATTSAGTGARSKAFTILDGIPTTTCPNGRTTGDSGCGNLVGDPVNTLSGAFTYADRDFSMPVRGGSLDVWRSYDSQLTRSLAMGPGWTYAYSDSLLVQAGSKVTWRTSQGASIEFGYQSGATWKAPFGNSARLTQNGDGSFTIRTEDL